MKIENKLLVVFFSIFSISSIVIQVLIIGQESFIQGSKILGLILMWLPGISAITTLLIYKIGLTSIGWKIGTLKYHIIGYFFANNILWHTFLNLHNLG